MGMTEAAPGSLSWRGRGDLGGRIIEDTMNRRGAYRK
jgi:hypothetical protein